jgi:predicted S18 family serine protease
MSSQELITVIAAVGLVLTNLITAWRTGAQMHTLQETTERTADRADEKATDLKETTKVTAEALKAVTERTAARADEKLDKIHELTNSNLSAVKTDLLLANERIAKLEAMLQKVLAEPEGGEKKAAAAAALAKIKAKDGDD